MGGAGVLGAQFIHSQLSGGAIGNGLHAADEATLADFQNAGDGTGEAVHGGKDTRSLGQDTAPATPAPHELPTKNVKMREIGLNAANVV